MTIGGILTAVVMIAGHNIWHQRNPEQEYGQLYQPVSAEVDDRELSDAQRIYNQSIASIVFIEKYRDGRCQGHGSGFFLYPGDKIITNYHVIADCDYALIETYWRQQFRVDSVMSIDRQRDLAVMPTPKSIKPKSVELANRTHAQGERVYTIGSPKDVRFGISEGVIVTMGELRGSHRGTLVQADISVAPGASGSPLLDCDGRVIGIISRASLTDRKYSFAVHSDELRRLLSKKSTLLPLRVGG